jgi:hypothetical protein
MIDMLRQAAIEAGADPDAAFEHFFGREDLDEYKTRHSALGPTRPRKNARR